MANQWFRLWHDMPTDPKWRTISRISGQPISVVQAMFIHLLSSASQNVTRGHAVVTLEDLASALDVSDDVIEAIYDAMQGRVLDEMKLLGWEKRQPKREDDGDAEGRVKSAAQRKREQRERERIAAQSKNVTQCHATSQNVTLDKDKDKDKDKDLKDIYIAQKRDQNKNQKQKGNDDDLTIAEQLKFKPAHVDIELWGPVVKHRKKFKAVQTKRALDGFISELEKIEQAGISMNEALNIYLQNTWKSIKLEFLKNIKDKPNGRVFDHNGHEVFKQTQGNFITKSDRSMSALHEFLEQENL